MIGRLEKTVLDCPDPRALAGFYAAVLGMRINEDHRDGGWVVIGRGPGMRELAFQRADPYVPPRWPDAEHPQQEHLDHARCRAPRSDRGQAPSPFGAEPDPPLVAEASGCHSSGRFAGRLAQAS